MPHQPHSYETAFIVNAGLDDPQIEAVVEKVKDAIVKNGGTIQDVDHWGRKRFAYPLRKKNNGYYVICTFQGTGETVARLDRFYQLEENILRHLTIVLTKHAIKAKELKAAQEQEAKDNPEAAPATEPAKA